jgi:undecaprenyl-diphosphatase
MDAILVAVILGIVEGLTEFLPVSSTGHLIIATDLLKQNQESLASFNIIIQFGAILAVVYLYFDRFKSFFKLEKLKELKNNYQQKNLNLIHVALAIVPVLGIGFVTRKFIKAHLYNPAFVTFTTVFVAIIMIIMEKRKPKATVQSIDEITYKDAFIVGLGQCFALFPGVSRSGATMLTAMARKFEIGVAADFSFLISVPVITAATLYELLKSFHEFHSNQILTLAIGLLVSFIVAILAIKTFLKVLKKLGLTPFAYYRIAFGLAYYLLKLR